MASTAKAAARDGTTDMLEITTSGDTTTVALSGAWTTDRAAPLDRRLASLEVGGGDVGGGDVGGGGTVVLDLGRIVELDTTGALLILRTLSRLRDRGVAADLAGVGERFQGLLEAVSNAGTGHADQPDRPSTLVTFFTRIGRSTFGILAEARNLLEFLGAVVVTLLRAAGNPRRVRLPALVSQMEQTGLNALPIVGLLSFLIGVVLAYQGADQLARFGAEIYTVNLVGIGVLREMGVLITAIIVAGRSGSAFTAQIGTMKVNQEIDAMSTLGLDPLIVLVLPRVLGLMLVMPLLVFYADVLALLGAAVMASVALDISFSQFITQLNNAVPISHFWVGLVKAPLFAFVIAVVGCYEGLQVSQSAESVGRMTTKAVVQGVFLIIVLDAFLSIFFSLIGV